MKNLTSTPSSMGTYAIQLQDWRGTEDERDDLEAHIIAVCSNEGTEAWKHVEASADNPAEIFLTMNSFVAATAMHDLFLNGIPIDLMTIRGRINRKEREDNRASISRSRTTFRHFVFLGALGVEEKGKIIWYDRDHKRGKSNALRKWDMTFCGIEQPIAVQDSRKPLCPSCRDFF